MAGSVGRPGREPVDVAVVHAERRGDQHRVVDLDVGRALPARVLHVLGRDGAAVVLHLRGDREQRTQLVADRSAVGVDLHLVDELHAAVELLGRERAVRGLAEDALVQVRDVGGDQLALASGERVFAAEQHFCELAEGRGRLGPEHHRAPDPGNAFGQIDVGHGSLPSSGLP